MPRLVDHDARKRELLDASLALVASEGIEAATLRRLARAADCTTGAITYYFEGRDALLVAMLRRAHQTTGARMLRAAGRGASPRDRLWAVLMEALPLDPERLAEWRVWLAFWGAAAGNPALVEENLARYAEWRALLQTLVRDLAGTQADLPLRVDALMGLIDGFGLQIALSKGLQSEGAVALRQSAERVLKAQVDALMDSEG
ncbi:MAG: TetR family transcriptional regulator C-terminal domain-containing protein [Phenylobacterium sp.]|jgi:AcrR family transcriptional regulator|uniref:TetR/AcrR family transcriptional regulator n=1 Tax=Phenylobacterium sp. TaxID=1871053 RepID=UPI0025D06B30|nr:TetR/AcrR family transcriptional regulator [Phenylobacterium sp.]MCA6300146.1 TetR family transcriptional regulator C-terminal domain-containing protein [Phenylobacterium sp.]MCE2988187.1 TetR family transcriptional regulator C-terminal domain-containing protein [Phenylobacterium sp.]